MISDNTDTNCNKARCVDGGYIRTTGTEGIEHGRESVEQQALLGGQSVTANGRNEVRGKKSIRELPKGK